MEQRVAFLILTVTEGSLFVDVLEHATCYFDVCLIFFSLHLGFCW